jgi:hypothetical protein
MIITAVKTLVMLAVWTQSTLGSPIDRHKDEVEHVAPPSAEDLAIDGIAKWSDWETIPEAVRELDPMSGGLPHAFFIDPVHFEVKAVAHRYNYDRKDFIQETKFELCPTTPRSECLIAILSMVTVEPDGAKIIISYDIKEEPKEEPKELPAGSYNGKWSEWTNIPAAMKEANNMSELLPHAFFISPLNWKMEAVAKRDKWCGKNDFTLEYKFEVCPTTPPSDCWVVYSSMEKVPGGANTITITMETK